MLKNNKIISSIFILFGLVFILIASCLVWQRNISRRLVFNTSRTNNQKVINNDKNQPKGIIIKDLQISLPLIPSKFENGIWESTNKGVSYLLSSPIPGEKGNSILYGHNWPNLLGNLTKAKKGQIISIKFENGRQTDFFIENIIVVAPDQTQILSPSANPKLTLYTCTGFLDNKRFVVTAIPKKSL